MTLTGRLLLGLIVLGIIDTFVPLPVIGLLLLFIILARPRWFRNAVEDLYKDNPPVARP